MTAFLFFFCFVHFTEEATIRTCMASNTSLFYIDQQSIIVAITVHTDDFLQMSGSCTFIPKFLPRTTPEPSVSGFQCLFQAFSVHICQHQHGFGVDFIDNCWNQVAFFKIGIQIQSILIMRCILSLSCFIKLCPNCPFRLKNRANQNRHLQNNISKQNHRLHFHGHEKISNGTANCNQ